ncbi:OmpA family protein [bacterium]|nr:OmpA family protein [bacterium]
MSVRFAIPIKAVLIVSALALGACRNPDRYAGAGGDMGANGANGANGAGGAGGIATSNLGDPSNPASVAYFNQAIGDRVHFVVDDWTLTDEARGILKAQATWLNAHASYGIIIEGYADEQGTQAYNLGLSQKRAASVKNFLISQGVAGARMQAIGYGKERPVALCSDESCYSQNRRAVTVLSIGAGT